MTRWLLSVVALIGACSASTAADVPVATSVTTSLPASSTTTTEVPAPTSTTTTVPLDPGALVTPTGVVVAIQAVTAGGYVITTPCGNQGYVSEGDPVGVVDVVLDPGHGGPIDTGAVAHNGLIERDLNLQVAEATMDELLKQGVTSLLTRTADYAMPLFVRANLADSVRPEILVSIHHNAPTPQIADQPGTEVFIQSNSEESSRLGGLLYEHVVRKLRTFRSVQWHAADDAGVLIVHNTRGADAYGMIRMPETPTALIEMAYISSRDEADLLATNVYVDVAAKALADGIVAYLHSDGPGSGYVGERRVFNPLSGVGPEVCEEVPLD